jgi:class 3 adenylate cyclase/tetratricopeptide (TPR) repeat protein
VAKLTSTMAAPANPSSDPEPNPHPPAARPDLLAPYVPQLLLRWPNGVVHQTRHGSMVSADISGFTALSERLAAKGREGSEELTTIVNGCFTGMIDDCDRHGGDVLKFGGDALLVFFEGDRHAERACRAAHAMRRTIRTPRRTRDGRRVHLAVSIGVHSGDVDLFVVRSGHDELLVSGVGSTATVDAEAAANAGEILLTTAAAANLPPIWLGRPTADGVLLARVFGASRPAPRPPAFRRPEEFVAAEQAAQILAGAANEHRQVSVSFVEFAHTDAMPRDELAHRLQSLAATIDGACERFGVHFLSTDVYHDGGKFILTAGVPTSRGGDEDRMLRAVREVIDADPGLHLRAGVNRGYVFAGDLGAPGRRVYTTMGDAVNLAARLMAKAAAGEVVASRPIVDWASSEMEYEPLEPFMVKGKSAPIHAGRLGRVLGRRTDLDRTDTELCGRTDELGLLIDRVASARAGRGSVSVITGEPGIGKSRLALEVVRQSPDLTLAFTRCQPYDRLAPYSVVEPLLRAVLGIPADASPTDAGAQLLDRLEQHGPDAVAFAPLLAAAIGAAVAPSQEADAVVPAFRRTRTLQLLVELIQRAVVEPTIFYVDDVNLADDPSREVLQALIESIVDTPLVVVATSVPDETLHPHPVRLGPLTADDVSSLLDHLLGEQVVAPTIVRDVVARSAGNPLFLGELVRSLAEDPNAAMPDSLEALVSSRVDALEPADRQLLRHASVLGVEVDITLLGRATGDDLIRRQDRWERLSRFLEWAAPGVVRFRYDTYWRVVYGGLSFGARRAAHRRVIELIEEDLVASAAASSSTRTEAEATADPVLIGRLAVHAERAGDRARTWTYANAAAANAAGRSLFGTAAQLYESALEARDAAPRGEIADVAERAANALNLAGSFEAANRALVIGLRLRRHPPDRARLLRLRGEIAERSGNVEQASQCFRRARAIWRAEEFGAEIVEQARLKVAEAALAYRQSRYADAWDLASAALAQGNTVDEPSVAARAGLLINNLVFHIKLRGHDLHGLDLAELYRRAGDRLGEAVYLNNRAVDLYYEGDWVTAAALYREAAEIFVTTGDLVSEAMALNNIAEILSDQGRLADAESMFRDAGRTWRSVGFVTGIALVEANLGRLATRLGDYEQADVLLGSSSDRFVAIGAQSFVHEVELRRIENDVRGGRELDRECLARYVDLARTADLDANLVVYVERLIAAVDAEEGRRGAARDAHDRGIAAARRAGLEFDLALALVDRGDPSDLSEARSILDRLGVAPESVRPLRAGASATVSLSGG